MTAATSKVEQEGFTYYDWNVDVDDAGSARTTNKIYENFVAGIAPKRENVVLMHDGYGHQPTAAALQELLDYATETGYVFSAITEDTIPVQHGVHHWRATHKKHANAIIVFLLPYWHVDEAKITL